MNTMPRNHRIAGISYEDYMKIYIILTRGFPLVLKKKEDENYPVPKKFCHVLFSELENIYDTLLNSLPHLFDSDGHLKRYENKKSKGKKKVPKKVKKAKKNSDPIVLSFN